MKGEREECCAQFADHPVVQLEPAGLLIMLNRGGGSCLAITMNLQ
jgi:hypothetical protein